MKLVSNLQASVSSRHCHLRAVLLCLALLVLVRPPVAHAQASTGSWVTGPQADAIWQTMAQSPYAQDGNHGLVMYMVTYSACPNCIRFLNEFWQIHRADIQLREIFAPVTGDPRFLNEAADVALTRSSAAANAYYRRSAVAPPINSVERRAALNQSERFLEQMNAFCRQFGHIQNSFPTFVFKVRDGGQDKVFIISGWGDANLARDMTNWVASAAH